MSDDHYEGGMPLIHNRRCTCEKCCPKPVRQEQAGVSAERVVKTCLHCKKLPVQLGRAYCDECFYELLNGDCAAPGCKHEQALATAPTCGICGANHAPGWGMCASVPQPASDGALEKLVAKWRQNSKGSSANEYVRGMDYQAGICANELAAALASHDQKVRREVLREANERICLLPRFVSFGKDYVSVSEAVAAIRSLAAPAASKPAADAKKEP